jgi:hypothetical protein
MRQRRCQLFCVVCCFLFFGCASPAQTLQIINTEGHATTLTATQIANLPHVAVDAARPRQTGPI